LLPQEPSVQPPEPEWFPPPDFPPPPDEPPDEPPDDEAEDGCDFLVVPPLPSVDGPSPLPLPSVAEADHAAGPSGEADHAAGCACPANRTGVCAGGTPATSDSTVTSDSTASAG
jgi:hypothetical protein